MGLPGGLLRGVLWGSGGLLSLAVLLLAVTWGLHESSALKPGRGVEVPASLYGTNAIITGSTSGIGFEAALQLYQLGAHVIVHSSSQERAEKSASAIHDLAFNWGGKATPLAANLADSEEVVAFATKLPAVMPRVHLLFLNAAMSYGSLNSTKKKPDSFFQSKSGYDSVMATNHLGHYLMTLLVLPQLAPKASIVVMTSAASWSSNHVRLMPPWGYLGGHTFNKLTSTPKRIRWESLKPAAGLAYADSKLANVCFARWLRRQLGENYTVILHDPGLVHAAGGMDRESRFYQDRLYRRIRSKLLKNWPAPTVDGGRHMLQAAFVTQRPVPDWVVSYFFPEQVVRWFNGYYYESHGRGRLNSWFLPYQKLTWGLHSSIGPECDEDVQDRFMAWSIKALGGDQPFPKNFP